MNLLPYELNKVSKQSDHLKRHLRQGKTKYKRSKRKLRESQGARDLQKYAIKRKGLKRCQQNLSKVEFEIAGWVGENGIYVAAKKLADATLEFIEDTSARGVIPSPYNEEFVRGLLEANMCICM